MSNKQKIIFFTPIVPLPPTGAGTRSYNMIKALSEISELDVVIYSPLSEIEVEKLNEICSNIFYIKPEIQNKKNGVLKKIQSGFKIFFPFLMNTSELSGRLNALNQNLILYPTVVRIFLFIWLNLWFTFRNAYPSEVHRLERNINFLKKDIDILLKNNPKVLFFDFNYFIPIFFKKFKLIDHIIIGNSHNSEAELINQNSKNIKDFIGKRWNKIQYNRMEIAERKSLDVANIIFCCSLYDINNYKNFESKAELHLVPNGVDTNYFTPKSINNHNLSLLFTGTMGYGPNSQGINWFIDCIFPLLIKKYPDLLLLIAGKDACMINTKNIKNIKLYSNPKDIRPIFNQATIYIVPLKQGSGTRLKILEAASMKIPIVSTTKGAEGITGLNSSNILIADDEESFSDAIEFLIENIFIRQRQSDNLYELVSNQYSWNKIRSNIKNIIAAA